MRILENVNKTCYKIATINELGKWKLGSLVASFLAFPLIIALCILAHLSIVLFHWALILGMISLLVCIHFALRFDLENARSAIVLDKVMGLMLAFWAVPFRWRIMIFGFLLFYIFNNVKTPTYNKFIFKMEKLPGVLGVVLPDLFSGLLVNISLQVMLWALG